MRTVINMTISRQRLKLPQQNMFQGALGQHLLILWPADPNDLRSTPENQTLATAMRRVSAMRISSLVGS